MLLFRHANYVELWNAMEEAAAAPYPVVVWDMRTGALLAASDAAAAALGHPRSVSQCSFTCDLSYMELFQQLRNRESLEATVHCFSPHASGTDMTLRLFYPLSPDTCLPVNVTIVPALLRETPGAAVFMRALALRLNEPERPNPIVLEGDRLDEESAKLLLSDYYGTVYIKDPSGKMLGCSPEFLRHLSLSREEDSRGLDISKENVPSIRPVSRELDQETLDSGDSVAFMSPNRRPHEIFHVWRRILRIPIVSATGAPAGILLVLRVLQDIDLLRVEQERLRRIFGILHSHSLDLPYLLFVWRDNGMHYIDYVSKSVLNLSVSTYELVELPDWAELVHPDDRQLFWDSRAALSKKPGEATYRMTLPDNREVNAREVVTKIGSEGYFNWNISRVYLDESSFPNADLNADSISIFHQIEQRQAYINQMQIDFNRRSDMGETIADTLRQICELFGIEIALLFEERDGEIQLTERYKSQLNILPDNGWPVPNRRSLAEAARIRRNFNLLLLRENDEIPEFCAELKRVSGMQNLHIATIHDEDGPFGLLCFMENSSHTHWLQRDHNDLLQFTQMLSGFVCRSRIHRKLLRLAYRDPVLDIPNNVALGETIDSRQHSVTGSSLVILQILNLSTVDSAYGVRYGQAFLKSICGAALRIFPEKSLYRLSHTQFALYLNGVGISPALSMLKTFFARFSEPWDVYDKQVFGLASAGLAELTPDCDANEVIRRASVALDTAQHLETNVYTESYKPAVQRLELLADLHQEASLGFPNILLYFQPIFNLAKRRFNSVEALVRWEHPVLGFLSPIRFIDLAEQSGLIVPLTEHVLFCACRQLKFWRGLGLTDLTVSINASQRVIREPNLTERFLQIIRSFRLDPSLVILELTESMAIQNTKETNCVLQAMRDGGLHIAFDDFGCGFSSLSMLKSIPLDIIKLDKDFIAHINDFDELIIQFAVNAADLRHMSVCAEGVETVEQWKQAQSLGVHMLQGYMMHKPAPAEVITPLLLDPSPFLQEKGL